MGVARIYEAKPKISQPQNAITLIEIMYERVLLANQIIVLTMPPAHENLTTVPSFPNIWPVQV